MAAPMTSHAETMPDYILSILKAKDDGLLLTTTLRTVVRSPSELSAFHQDGASVAELASYINKCLTVSSTRLVGMALMEPLIAQSSAQLFQQHCISWLRLLTQIIQPFSSTAQLQLASALITKVLSKASRHPDVSRDVATSLIHPLVENALQLKDEKVMCSLDVLIGCMRYFPGPCGPLRNRLVGHVTSILGNSPDKKTVELACRCFALLPSLGGGGSGGVLHRDAWSYYMKKLVNSVALVLSELYKDFKPGALAPSQVDPSILLPEAPIEEPERTFTLADQLQRLLAAITELLRNDFPVTVIIPHEDIVTMVCDILAVSGRTLVLMGSLQASHLLMVISDIHTAALNLLSSLIPRCGSHLLSHLRTINQLFLQTLNWTAALDDNGTSKFRFLRTAVYESYGILLTTVGASAYRGENVERMVAHIIKDARFQDNTPQQESSRLHPTGATGNNEMGQPRKKKQKKQHQWRVQPVGGWGNKQEGDQHMERLCTYALRALRKLFFTCGSRMKWTLHRNVHSLVTKALLQCQDNLSLASVAYQSPLCRKELYHVLMSCILVPSPQWSAPFQSTIHIFSQGRLDPDVQVKQFCMESAAVLENIAHPRTPRVSCPLLPPPEEPAKDTLDLSSAIFPGSRITLADVTTDQGMSPQYPWKSVHPENAEASDRLGGLPIGSIEHERERANFGSGGKIGVGQVPTDPSNAQMEDNTRLVVGDGSGEMAPEREQEGEPSTEDDDSEDDNSVTIIVDGDASSGEDDGEGDLDADGNEASGASRKDASADGQGVAGEGHDVVMLEGGAEGPPGGDDANEDPPGSEQILEAADESDPEKPAGEPSVAEMLAAFSAEGPDTGE